MKMVLSVVMGAVISLMPAVAVAWPNAGPKSVADEPCASILRLKVFDAKVNPPHHWVNKWLAYLEENPSHELITKKGNVLTVATTDPNALMAFAAEFPQVTEITKNGKPIPNFHAVQVTTISGEPQQNEQRAKFYQALGFLPEGAYDLVDAESNKPFTMFVNVGPVNKSFRPLTSLGLSVELWPGTHSVPQTEATYHQKSVTTVSNSGTDYFYVIFRDNSFELMSSYGAAMQTEEDLIKFNLGNKGELLSIGTKGRSYNLVGLRPLGHVTQR